MTTNTIPAAFINAYDFSKVANRAVKDRLVTSDEAPEAVKELKAFFVACARKEMNLSPQSGQCDALWHTFIIQTRAYAAFCDQAFGGFLHHETDIDADILASAQDNADKVLGTSVFKSKKKPECGDIRRECGRIRQIAA